MEYIIDVKNLTKSYLSGAGRLVVLNNLNLSLPRGQFMSITGKSGSGKSTLLYQLSLLDEPDSGEIIIDNINVSHLSSSKRTAFRLNKFGYILHNPEIFSQTYLTEICSKRTAFRLNKFGYIFQDYALVPDLCAIDNIMLPLLMLGEPKSEALKAAQSALVKVGLGDKAYSLPNQLSGGQQQRISIARAIAHNPDIIFADEPTANLDTEMSHIVLQTFLELNRAGQTIIMVTHEKDYAEMAHRVITLSDGKIISDIIKSTSGSQSDLPALIPVRNKLL